MYLLGSITLLVSHMMILIPLHYLGIGSLAANDKETRKNTEKPGGESPDYLGLEIGSRNLRETFHS